MTLSGENVNHEMWKIFFALHNLWEFAWWCKGPFHFHRSLKLHDKCRARKEAVTGFPFALVYFSSILPMPAGTTATREIPLRDRLSPQQRWFWLINCEIFLDVNQYAASQFPSASPPSHGALVQWILNFETIFPTNPSYYISTTIDEMKFRFSCSVESIHAVWKHCIPAPTGVVYMNHELFAPLQLPSHPNRHRVWGDSVSFSLRFLLLFFSVEFESSFGKGLIFVAGFGSTLFPFIFRFIHSVIINTGGRIVQPSYSIIEIYCF